MMHYYKKNIGDYHTKAGRLNMLQHGAYTLLMDSCYDREEFPTLEQAIDWTWASTTEEVEAVKFVLSKFFTLVDGVYIQERIEEEIEKYHKNAKTNQRIAIERETKRREKRTNRAKTVNESQAEADEPPPNQEPITKNQEPITKNQDQDIKRSMSALADLDSVNEVFEHWRMVMGKQSNSALNAKRSKAIRARLAEGYSVEYIKTAILGCSLTPHNMGRNDNGKRYDDIELICRNGCNLERFANNASHQHQPVRLCGEAAEKTMNNLANLELR
jgi:uncharacterized protein YdaU (DUF1376 family)